MDNRVPSWVGERGYGSSGFLVLVLLLGILLERIVHYRPPYRLPNIISHLCGIEIIVFDPDCIYVGGFGLLRWCFSVALGKLDSIVFQLLEGVIGKVVKAIVGKFV